MPDTEDIQGGENQRREDPGRRVRLFRNGRNQAVRIPREYELPGDEAVIRRDGDRLVLEPQPHTDALSLLATWAPLDVALPETGDTLLPLDDPEL